MPAAAAGCDATTPLATGHLAFRTRLGPTQFACADGIHRTGAGFVVFTTSHVRQFFPSPLAALDRVLPGRTTRRDLVGDLADALGRRGLRLMLYYHLGTSGDEECLKASGFGDTESSRFFANWQAIVGEAGERYRERLAGWWFDDGATTYYSMNPPCEALAWAAKADFPGRLVCFNPWEFASPTEFQDFFAGEGFHEPQGFDRLLVRDGEGRYPSGVHAGLQATACLVTESDCVHTRRDTPPWHGGRPAPLDRSPAARSSPGLRRLRQRADLQPRDPAGRHRVGPDGGTARRRGPRRCRDALQLNSSERQSSPGQHDEDRRLE